MSQALAAKKIARQYVISLFSVLETKTAITNAVKDLKDLGAMLSQSQELEYVVSSPLVSRLDQKNAMAAMAKAAKFSKPVSNCLQLMAENGRLDVLTQFIEEANVYQAEQAGVVSAQVTTARALTAADSKKIQSDLKATLGNDVLVEAHVDESLIGGMVVQVGSTLIDGSLKTKLDQLERKLAG